MDVCAYWDVGEGRWSDWGCRALAAAEALAAGCADGTLGCACNHTTDFAVVEVDAPWPTASFGQSANFLTLSDLAATLTSLGEMGSAHGVLTVAAILSSWLALGLAFTLADSFTWRATTPPVWMRRQHESMLRAYWAKLHRRHRVWSALICLPSTSS